MDILFINTILNLGILILDPGWFFLISLRATESLSCIARASVAWPSMSYVSPTSPQSSDLLTEVWSLPYPGTIRSTKTVQPKHGQHVPTPSPWRQVIGVVRQILHFASDLYQWTSNLQLRKTQPKTWWNRCISSLIMETLGLWTIESVFHWRSLVNENLQPKSILTLKLIGV